MISESDTCLAGYCMLDNDAVLVVKFAEGLQVFSVVSALQSP